jgi:hypothetical protein
MFRKITCKNLTGLANLSGLAREIIFLTNYRNGGQQKHVSRKSFACKTFFATPPYTFLGEGEAGIEARDCPR